MLSKKEVSQRQERMVAELLGWQVVSGSGARPTHVGDIVSDAWIGECKTHTSPGHRVVFDAKVWCKIKDEANSKFKYPVLICDDGSQAVRNTWCMFDRLDTVLECTICDYPLVVKTNITFDTYELEKQYAEDNSASTRIVIYKLPDGRFICSLRVFYLIVTGDE